MRAGGTIARSAGPRRTDTHTGLSTSRRPSCRRRNPSCRRRCQFPGPRLSRPRCRTLRRSRRRSRRRLMPPGPNRRRRLDAELLEQTCACRSSALPAASAARPAPRHSMGPSRTAHSTPACPSGAPTRSACIAFSAFGLLISAPHAPLAARVARVSHSSSSRHRRRPRPTTRSALTAATTAIVFQLSSHPIAPFCADDPAPPTLVHDPCETPGHAFRLSWYTDDVKNL